MNTLLMIALLVGVAIASFALMAWLGEMVHEERLRFAEEQRKQRRQAARVLRKKNRPHKNAAQ